MECAVSLKQAVIGQMDEKATLINNPEHLKQNKKNIKISLQNVK